MERTRAWTEKLENISPTWETDTKLINECLFCHTWYVLCACDWSKRPRARQISLYQITEALSNTLNCRQRCILITVPVGYGKSDSSHVSSCLFFPSFFWSTSQFNFRFNRKMDFPWLHYCAKNGHWPLVSNPSLLFPLPFIELCVTGNMAFLFHCAASKLSSAQPLRHPLLRKNLAAISAFFSTSSSQSAIKNVMVIGSGLMGAGIAQVRMKIFLAFNNLIFDLIEEFSCLLNVTYGFYE